MSLLAALWVLRDICRLSESVFSCLNSIAQRNRDTEAPLRQQAEQRKGGA